VRPESKSRIITIEQIRELIQTMNLKANEAAHKVSIIVDADRLNTQSANAFLKTLEEPAAGSVIILLTTALERVLETIHSRCLRLHLASDSTLPLDAEDQDWLTAFGQEALTGAKSLLGRYRLLDLLVQRLTRLKEAVEKRLTNASPLTRYPDVEGNLRRHRGGIPPQAGRSHRRPAMVDAGRLAPVPAHRGGGAGHALAG
jgi:DNA polymerase III subunit delta'